MSKEAIMTLSLGVTAYGIARVLARLRGGYPLVLMGALLGLWVRPNELVLLLVGFAVAMVLRAPDVRGANRPIRVVGSFVFVVGVVALSGVLTSRFLHAAGGSGLTGTLTHIQQNNQGSGSGFGSSNVSFSTNPLFYPRDVYNVLFNPLPVTARSLTQLFAAAENTVILVVLLMSLRQLRCLVRAARRRPYVLVALVYSAAFLYAFAALGNLGLITRERTLLLPLFFVLLAIPLASPGSRPYPWQEGRRPTHRRPAVPPTGERTESGGPGSTVPSGVVETERVSARWEAAEPARAVWGQQNPRNG